MKSLMFAISTAALLGSAPAIAQAQDASGVYGSVGYSHHKADDLSVGAIQGRLGARFNNYIGVEGELGFGVKGDEVAVAPGVNADVELEHQAAVYGVGFLPLSPNTDLFARVGYGTTEGKVSAPGVSASAEGESWNYGVGVQHFFDGANGVRLDYTRHEFEDDAGESDVWSVGYVRRF